MNKIAFLKLLIAGITFLIFLTLGGIVYGLVNYKTTPKILSRKNASASKTIVQAEAEKVPEIHLDLKKGENIKSSHACGEMLCLHINSSFEGNKIIVFDPTALQIKAVLIGRQKETSKYTLSFPIRKDDRIDLIFRAFFINNIIQIDLPDCLWRIVFIIKKYRQINITEITF